MPRSAGGQLRTIDFALRAATERILLVFDEMAGMRL
jgi:hypothetical protein